MSVLKKGSSRGLAGPTIVHYSIWVLVTALRIQDSIWTRLDEQ